MRCASCGEEIMADPVWRDHDPYCCEECADVGPFDEDQEEYEEELEEEEE